MGSDDGTVTVSKKYKGKLCVYCARSEADGADHVLSRKFFLQRDRRGLPKVPACTACNGSKSELEGYALTVLPFGGRHAAAAVGLATQVTKRLHENAPLQRELANGLRRGWATSPTGLISPVTLLPVDSDRLDGLFALIARGLLWHHYGAYLSASDVVRVTTLTRAGECFFDEEFFRPHASHCLTVSLGGGTVCYEGIQTIDCPQGSVWRLRMLGGLQFAGDAAVPHEVGSAVGIITGPFGADRDASETEDAAPET